MTYAQLIEALGTIPFDRLNDTVTIYEPYSDEYIPAVHTSEVTDDQDVLDPGHFVIVLKA